MIEQLCKRKGGKASEGRDLAHITCTSIVANGLGPRVTVSHIGVGAQ